MRNLQICGHRLLPRYTFLRFQITGTWKTHKKQYAKESNVIFGLMNEPHDVPDLKIWATTCQAAVTAIRKAGATTQLILLPGNNFTSVTTFISNGSAGNLSTVTNPDGSLTGLIFDVHKYLDVDNSGTHLECTTDHIADGFQPLATFLRANNRTAILSETGGGNTTSVSSFQNSMLLKRMLIFVSSVSRTCAQP